MKPALSILLSSDDAGRIARWVAAISAAGVRVFTSANDLPDGEVLDVIVTDRPASVESAASICRTENRGDGSSGRSRGVTGVVSVGATRGDVQLPADASDRELSIACRLLGEAVRLRRRVRRSETVRRALSSRAASDPLTGLPNRLAWQKQLKRRSAAARSSSEAITLALIDLDHFREINAQRGYAAGDEALRQAARALRDTLRDRDFVARWGGDEFAVLVSGFDAESSWRLIEAARTAIGRESAPHVDAVGLKDVPLNASAGVATSRDGQIEAETLLASADEALRSAKAKGRNRTICQQVPHGRS